MKRPHKIALIALLSFGLVGGAVAYGKHKMHEHEGHIAHVVEHISDKLDLNDTQEQALDDLKNEIIAGKEKMHSTKQAIRKEIMVLVTADTFDQERALAFVNKRPAIIEESAPAIIAALGSFMDSLDAEQKAKIAKFIERKAARHSHHHD